MPEPTSTTGAAGAALVAIATSMLGVKYGPLATIAFAAFTGTLISLGEVATAGRVDALWYVIRYVLMAVVIAGTLSLLIERFTGLPAVEMLALVAFAIGWLGNRWKAVKEAGVKALGAFAGRGTGR